ncbi:hypothetical protein CHLRE_10g447250v5 [Chlamydomonas reinhardtii]|uniref:Uncharacterized protein n=1 Tax=Chlamydomonas reinhardtii TaxID=3055 RepID=A0A2K3DAX4_CHLRE|nr:uncharacterized protein CHLRE_10g447250v5 [Chlamydomonas reinhardtii]PNW77685.1 hypothetical protein CHLRE_10g447250v5 [Chlamydomonas reinhardtii]
MAGEGLTAAAQPGCAAGSAPGGRLERWWTAGVLEDDGRRGRGSQPLLNPAVQLALHLADGWSAGGLLECWRMMDGGGGAHSRCSTRLCSWLCTWRTAGALVDCSAPGGRLERWWTAGVLEDDGRRGRGSQPLLNPAVQLALHLADGWSAGGLLECWRMMDGSAPGGQLERWWTAGVLEDDGRRGRGSQPLLNPAVQLALHLADGWSAGGLLECWRMMDGSAPGGQLERWWTAGVLEDDGRRGRGSQPLLNPAVQLALHLADGWSAGGLLECWRMMDGGGGAHSRCSTRLCSWLCTWRTAGALVDCWSAGG